MLSCAQVLIGDSNGSDDVEGARKIVDVRVVTAIRPSRRPSRRPFVHIIDPFSFSAF